MEQPKTKDDSHADLKADPATRRRLTRWWQKLALAVASLFVFLLAGEIALRFLGYGNVEIYEPHPVLYWRLQPNQHCYTKIDHKPVHINSLGTRGPAFAPQKPANTIRILSLGDSRTFGWGMTEGEAYSGLLEAKLQKQFAPKRVEIINAGVNAWSYPQILVYFRDYGLSYQPDYVLLADANLWTQFSEKSSPEFVKQFMWRVRLKNLLRRSALYDFIIEEQLKVVYERTRTRFIPVDPKQDLLFKEQQQKDPDALFRDSIEAICRLAQQNKIQPVLIYLPTLDVLQTTNVSNLLRAKRDVSQKWNVPLVDLTPDLRDQGERIYLPADPVHFNVEGNAIVANRVFQTLTNLAAR